MENSSNSIKELIKRTLALIATQISFMILQPIQGNKANLMYCYFGVSTAVYIMIRDGSWQINHLHNFKTHLRYFVVLLSLLFFSNWISAQVIHAGHWTGYWEGNGVAFAYTEAPMILKDTLLYFNSNGNGSVRFNTNTRQPEYFSNIANHPLDENINLRLSTIDPDGTLWTLETDSMLYSLDIHGNRKVEGPYPDYFVYCIQSDQQGRIWVGFKKYLNQSYLLARFENGNWIYINPGVDILEVETIAFDTQDVLWFFGSLGLDDTGWYKYNGSSSEIVDYNLNIDVHPEQLSFSTDGRIAGTGQNVFFYYQNGLWTVHKDKYYTYACFDENNLAWVSDDKGHLYRYAPNDPSPQFFMAKPENFRTGEGEQYWGFRIDANGKIWVGMNIGLFVIPDKNQMHADFVPLTNLNTPGIPVSLAGHKDTIWSVKGSVLTRLVNDSFERIEQPQTDISAIHYDTYRKALWICSKGRLGLLHDSNYSTININPLLNDSVNHNHILQVASDGLHNMWFLTTKELLRLDANGNWARFAFGEHYGKKQFFINRKDHSVWVRARWNGPAEPGKLFKISGQSMMDIGLDQSLLNTLTLGLGVVADDDYWFITQQNGSRSFLHYDHGQISTYPFHHTFKEEFNFINDSTFVVATDQGLYVFIDGTFIKPEIDHDLLKNTVAYPVFFGEHGKMVLGHNSILVLDDVVAFLRDLGYEVITKTEESTENLPLGHIRLYPNPSSGNIQVTPSLAEWCPDCTMEIVSIDGKIHLPIHTLNTESIDVSKIPQGLYVVNIRRNGKLIKTLQIIKQ